MFNWIFRISAIILGILLAIMIILTAVVGAGDFTLKVLGWFIVAFMVITLTLFIVKRVKENK